MRKLVRVGVIGVGAMGRNHVRIYSQLPKVDLIAVADVDEKLAASVAREYDCKPYADHNDLLNENLDAVSIAVPTTSHTKVALDVIQRGISILVEKPVTETVENANQIIEAAQQKGVKLMVGYIERFNPAIMKLKQLISNGQLGDIISISAKRVGPYNPKVRDVGVILDFGTHDIDIMSYLYGKNVKEVYALAGSVIHGHESHAIITLNFNNGGRGVIETNWLTPHKVRSLTVIGSKGIAEVNYIESTLRILDKEWVREAKIEKEEPLQVELLHFIDCVRYDRKPAVSGEDGRQALQVALAAMESVRTGKVYALE